ncbi:MAG: Multidrug resistance protein MdtA [Phycisphaerae bacterium]|nr:Multidrug resistance protein MdtA [Phycisphaerae bacterium]
MKRILAIIRITLVALVGVGAMVLLMYWLQGGFVRKVSPGQASPVAQSAIPATITVQITQVPTYTESWGTVQAEHETAVASKLLARVKEVKVSAGQSVGKGDPLVVLDDTEYKARLDQAQAALKQAQDDFERITKLHADGRATERELTVATNALAAAKAKVAEADAVWKDAVIVAPADGVVIDRLVQPGDTVSPGHVIARMFDHLQMVARVAESLRPNLFLTQSIGVRLQGLPHACAGTVSEIVPQADPTNRTFEVKVTGPCQPGVMIGNSGRIVIPTGVSEQILIPVAAVQRVGQITSVLRVVDGSPGGQPHLLRQFVELGSLRDGQYEVTSGLKVGDRIVADVRSADRG